MFVSLRVLSRAACVALCLALPVRAFAEGVDLAVAWNPGIYRFTQTVVQTVSIADQQRELTTVGELKLAVSEAGPGLTRYAASYQPEFNSVDGVATGAPPAIPEVAVVLDGEGRLVEIQDESGLVARHESAVAERIGEVLAPQLRLKRMQVNPGDHWSEASNGETLRWSLVRHHGLSGVAELEFRGAGDPGQLPEGALPVGVSLDLVRRELTGRVRLDTISNRLLRMVSRSTVLLRAGMPGAAASGELEMIQVQTMDLKSFEELP